MHAWPQTSGCHSFPLMDYSGGIKKEAVQLKSSSGKKMLLIYTEEIPWTCHLWCFLAPYVHS